jgi:hypothetical protein
MSTMRRLHPPRRLGLFVVTSTLLHLFVVGLQLAPRAAAEPIPPSAHGDAGLAETEDPGGSLGAVPLPLPSMVPIKAIGIIDDTPPAPAPPAPVPVPPVPEVVETKALEPAPAPPVVEPPPPSEPEPAAPPAEIPVASTEVAPPPAVEPGEAEPPPPTDPALAEPEAVAARTGKGHRPPRAGTGSSKCPPPVDTIEEVAESRWRIERPLVDYYAKHINELMKLGSVWAHKSRDGKPDGFRVGLARCSILRQGGLRSGDVVHDINGVRIHNIVQAVGAYLKLRTEPVLTLNVSRRGVPVTLTYEVEQKVRRKR